MITPEQTQNLKPGDKLLVEAYFLQEGCSYIKCALNPPYSFDTKTFSIHPYALSLPSKFVNSQSSIVNKYDPCRPFKAGDVARVVERFGRIDATHTLGALVTVTKDECGFTFVHVKHETGAEGLIPWLYLELVTPVEELEPYKLIDSPNTYNIVRDSAMVMTIHKKSHPNPKAAAEAECTRLNAEWRKEQNND
jgi:hypothetical protein